MTVASAGHFNDQYASVAVALETPVRSLRLDGRAEREHALVLEDSKAAAAARHTITAGGVGVIRER